jgi:hypothetical protein
MGFFTRNSVNKNKVKFFIQSLLMVASSDDDFSEEEQEFIRTAVLEIRNHYNYHKDIDDLMKNRSGELEKTIASLEMDDKKIMMSLLLEVAKADKILKLEEIGAIMTVASIIELELESTKQFFINELKEYNINEKLFNEYWAIFLDKGKDAANKYVEGKNQNIDVDSNIIYCPQCGAENSSVNKFCTSCGKKIDA